MFADVAILWEWEFDEDFVRLVDRKCQQFRLQSYLIQPYNQPKVFEDLKKGDFNARLIFDRASDNQPAFEPFVKKLLANGAIPLNHPDQLAFALDKAVMHQKLAENHVHVPYTIILSPYRDWTKIKIGELIRLGEPFIIKPQPTPKAPAAYKPQPKPQPKPRPGARATPPPGGPAPTPPITRPT